MRLRGLIAYIACLLCGLRANAADYSVINLGPLPAGYSGDVAEAINSAGDVAGYVTGAGPIGRAMRWSTGSGFDVLGTLGGTNSFAFGINDDGVVVGRSNIGAGIQTRPFRQSPGGMLQDLGTFGGNFGTAWDINNNGVITGVANNNSVGRAFVWQEGVGLTDIGNFTPAGASAGLGINISGHVVGFGTTDDDKLHAFFWDGASFTDLMTIASGSESMAQAVNDSDVVVGFGTLEEFGSTYGAFRWTADGGIVQLDQLFNYDTRALDVNNQGAAVGWSWLDIAGNSRAVLWEDAGPVINLNDRIDPASGWLLTTANGINDAGQIVGVGTLNGESRAFLLTPVPEPAAVGLAGTLFLLGAIIRWRAAPGATAN